MMIYICFVVKLTGHRYGSTLVPFSTEDTEAMKYKTEKCFKMLGFTKAENVHRCGYEFDANFALISCHIWL